MSTQLTLRENETTPAVTVTGPELLALREAIPGLRITPSVQSGTFDLTPGATVGAMQLGDRAIVIRPKVGIERLMFLLGYASDPKGWRSTLKRLRFSAVPIRGAALG
jgi:5-methylcytosine-specific restriction enzyme subunit McrC